MQELYKNLEVVDNSLSGYFVSYDGVVFSGKTGKPMNGSLSHAGHIVVRVNKRAYKVHRLIALAFIPNPDNLPYVHHINGDKQDNRVCNLEWVSADKHNTLHHKGVSKQQQLGKLSEDDIQFIRDNYIPKDRTASVGYFAKMFNVSKPTILKALGRL